MHKRGPRQATQMQGQPSLFRNGCFGQWLPKGAGLGNMPIRTTSSKPIRLVQLKGESLCQKNRCGIRTMDLRIDHFNTRHDECDSYGSGAKPMDHFGVGASPIVVYSSGDWDVHWGYDLAFDPRPYVCVSATRPALLNQELFKHLQRQFLCHSWVLLENQPTKASRIQNNLAN